MLAIVLGVLESRTCVWFTLSGSIKSAAVAGKDTSQQPPVVGCEVSRAQLDLENVCSERVVGGAGSRDAPQRPLDRLRDGIGAVEIYLDHQRLAFARPQQ